MEKIKVLVVLDTSFIGGIEKAALRFQQGMDQERFEFTFLIRLWPNGPMEKEAIQNGITVIHQPYSERSLFRAIKFYRKLFKEKKFDIVHCHSTFYNGVILKAAYNCDIKKRISHAHLTRDSINSIIKKIPSNIYSFMMQKILCFYATDLLACSRVAGESLYGKKEFNLRGVILDNPVDCDRYAFDESVRSIVRKELDISKNTIVWGHVGRLSQIKNQAFLIELFSEWKIIHKNSVLILVGDGDDRKILEDKAIELKCEDSIIFTGSRNDINRLLMAMDLFVFPSLHEGFPVSLIEAQTAKLPCLVSDTVTDEVKLNENMEFASLDDPHYVWLTLAEKLIEQDRESIDISKINDRFGIKNVGKKLETIYLSENTENRL